MKISAFTIRSQRVDIYFFKEVYCEKTEDAKIIFGHLCYFVSRDALIVGGVVISCWYIQPALCSHVVGEDVVNPDIASLHFLKLAKFCLQTMSLVLLYCILMSPFSLKQTKSTTSQKC